MKAANVVKCVLSINDCPEKDPNLVDHLSSTINRFRFKRTGAASEKKKAFLQFSLVNQTDLSLDFSGGKMEILISKEFFSIEELYLALHAALFY